MKNLILSTVIACGLAGVALAPASAAPAGPTGLGQPSTQVEPATRMGRYRLMRRRIIMNRMRRNRAMRRRGSIEQRPAAVWASQAVAVGRIPG